MIKNTQPTESQDHAETTVEVHSIFYTIQGEGPYSGHPAIFIRLAGCNLQCPGCDTDYTSQRNRMTVDEIVGRLLLDFEEQFKRPDLLVVITGGEPFRQQISPLCRRLVSMTLTVQIETNGTFDAPSGFPIAAKIVCSPKSGVVHPKLLHKITAYKYVLQHTHISPLDGLPLSILGRNRDPARPHPDFAGEVYLSPMDEQDIATNQLNTVAAAAQCMRFGYVLNIQLHKIAQLP